MQHSPRFWPQAGNPLANALIVVVGIAVIAVSIVIGFVAIVILSSIILVAALILSARVWWARRKFGAQSPREPAGGRNSDAEVIEGEYRVLGGSRDES